MTAAPLDIARRFPTVSGVEPLEEPETPDFAEKLGAAFQIENTVGSVIARGVRSREPEEEFNVFDELTEDELSDATAFALIDSREELEATRNRIRAEREARDILGEGSFLSSLTAGLIASVADPINLIPIVGPVAKTAAAGRGVGAMVRAGTVGGLAGSALAEGVLQATQTERTPAETLLNVLTSGTFGAGIGFVAGKVGQRAVDKAAEEIAVIARTEFPEEFQAEGGAAGAAATPRPQTAEDTLLKSSGKVAEGLAKLKKVGLAAPSLELSTSPFAASREIVQRLVDTGMFTEGNVVGRASATALDTRIRRYDAQQARLIGVVKEMHAKHKTEGGSLNLGNFNDEIGRALRRGDKHDDPFVQQAAQRLRKEIIDPLKNEAIRLGLLPEDITPKTAASYFTRRYNRSKIKARRAEFQEIASRYFQSKGLDEAEALEAAANTADAILGRHADQVDIPGFLKPAGGGAPLKERTFLIPDEEIEDFLEDSAVDVLSAYVRNLSSEIEYRTDFPDGIQDALDRIRRESNQAAKGKSEKEADRIINQGTREMNLVADLADHVRGIPAISDMGAYSGLGRFMRVARGLQFVRLLGSVLLSSVPDAGRIVMEEGLAKSFGTVFGDMANGFKGIRMAKDEAQLAGTALDMALSTRVRILGDLQEQYSPLTKFERGVDVVTNSFATLTLINPWNVALKSATSALAGTRILKTARAVATGRNVKQADVEKLARAGISKSMAERIARQADHWQTESGITLANSQAWTDAEAIDAFRNALLTDVDRTIITPGAGDAPLWTSAGWGKTIFQFKRFSAASTQRILISGLQQRDMAALNGVLLMVALGAGATAMRDIAKSDKGVKERTPQQWIAEGMDRSGAAAVFFELDAVLAGFTGQSAVATATGEDVSRFAGRNLLGRLAGPTAGLIEDVGAAGRAVFADDQFTQPDLHKVRRMMPGQNLFYMNRLFTLAEEGIADEFNLPERRK